MTETTIDWRIRRRGHDHARADALDVEAATRDTPHDGDVGATVAMRLIRFVVQADERTAEAIGSVIEVEISAPDIVAGAYRVVISRGELRGEPYLGIGAVRLLPIPMREILSDPCSTRIASISWSLRGHGGSRSTVVDVSDALRSTPDDGDLAATVAARALRTVVDPDRGLEDRLRGEAVVEIEAPPEYAGTFRVSIDRSTVRGRTSLGFLGRRVAEPAAPDVHASMMRHAARMVPADQVQESYEFLGTIHGRTSGQANDEVMRIMRHAAIVSSLVGEGWPVLSRITKEVGFLTAVRLVDEGDTLPEDIASFDERHGLAIQKVDEWMGVKQGFLVCFLPASLLAGEERVDTILADLREVAGGGMPTTPDDGRSKP